MTVQANYSINPDYCRPVALSNTTKTNFVLYDTQYTMLVGALFCNTTGSAIMVQLHYGDGTTDDQIYRKVVPASDTIVLEGALVRIQSGKKVSIIGHSGLTATPIVGTNSTLGVPAI